MEQSVWKGNPNPNSDQFANCITIVFQNQEMNIYFSQILGEETDNIVALYENRYFNLKYACKFSKIAEENGT